MDSLNILFLLMYVNLISFINNILSTIYINFIYTMYNIQVYEIIVINFL
jgi:hypothetical protein